MQERPTRLIILVALLLAAALMHLGSVGTTHAATQRRSSQKIFMPAVLQRPPATQDLSITHIGLYQTVQTAANSVSLIAHKPALLRVYAQAQGAATPPVAEAVSYTHLDSLRETRPTLDLDRLVGQVESSGAHVLTWDSPDYPSLLRQIPAAPPVIFVRGGFEPVDQWAVAIVGTRRLSAYGRLVAHEDVYKRQARMTWPSTSTRPVASSSVGRWATPA